MKKQIIQIPLDAINSQERIRALIRQKMRLMDMDLSDINRFESDCFCAANTDAILSAAEPFVEVKYA